MRGKLALALIGLWLGVGAALAQTSVGPIPRTAVGAANGVAPLDGSSKLPVVNLYTFTSSLAGAAPASGGGTVNFLRADGTWAAPAGGGSGTVGSGTTGQLAFYAANGTAVSPLSLGGGMAVNGSTLNLTAPNVTSTASYSIAAADMGGQRNMNGSSLTVTIPAISGTVLAQGMTVAITNQAASALTVSSTPTINGLANAGTLRTGGFMLLTSNGTSLDAAGFPGFGTVLSNALPKFLGADGGLGASGITDTGSQVTVSYLTSGATQCVQATSAGALQGTGAACGSGGGSGSSVPAIPQGRLTLTSGAPVMAADVSNASTIYYDCHRGAQIPYYNGSAIAAGTITGCELSVSMQTSGTGVVNSGAVVDVFYSGAGSALCYATNGSGLGWAGDTGGSTTARGTGYSQLHNTKGFWTNVNAITNCYTGTAGSPSNIGSIAADQGTYLGTVYTTGAGVTSMQFLPAGATGGSNNVLGLYNAYWRETVNALERDSTASYTTIPTSYRNVNASALNRITWVDGLGQSAARWDVGNLVGGSAGYQLGALCNTTSGAPVIYGYVSSAYSTAPASAACVPALGLNYVQAIELSQGGAANAYPFTTPNYGYHLGVAVGM